MMLQKNITKWKDFKLKCERWESNPSTPGPNLYASLNNLLENETRKRAGNVHENHHLDKLNIDVKNRNTKIYKSQLYDSDQFQIFIKGKIDGSADDCIVETKNHRNKLFNYVPVYEKIQVHCYIVLTGMKKCLHVENYKDETNETMIYFDNNFWDSCITELVNYISTHIIPNCDD